MIKVNNQTGPLTNACSKCHLFNNKALWRLILRTKIGVTHVTKLPPWPFMPRNWEKGRLVLTSWTGRPSKTGDAALVLNLRRALCRGKWRKVQPRYLHFVKCRALWKTRGRKRPLYLHLYLNMAKKFRDFASYSGCHLRCAFLTAFATTLRRFFSIFLLQKQNSKVEEKTNTASSINFNSVTRNSPSNIRLCTRVQVVRLSSSPINISSTARFLIIENQDAALTKSWIASYFLVNVSFCCQINCMSSGMCFMHICLLSFIYVVYVCRTHT